MPYPLIIDPSTKFDAEFSAGFISPPGYIDGLKMVWNSATSISVTSGTCYIPSLGYALQFTSALTLSGLSLTASTFYHLYGYSNAGTPAIELVTTVPAAPYNGTARAKTGDTSRRYLGSVKTDASGNVFNFVMNGLRINYYADLGGGASPFRLLTAGSAATATTISASVVVPITSKLMAMRAFNLDTGGPARFLNSVSGISLPASILSIPPDTGGVATNAFVDFPLDASQAMQYFINGTPSGAGCYVDCLGYAFER